MRPTISLRKALADPALLGNALAGDSWANWQVMLLAVAGEKLKPAELEIFKRFTGRETSPSEMVTEAAFVIGRRGGKDGATAPLSVWLAALCDHRDVLVPGERGVLLCIAPDQRQARVQLDRIEGVFNASPILSQLVTGRTTDTLSLSNGIDIEVRSASFRRLRGMTAIGVVASECAFWHSDENSANPDTEILNAVRPALATTSGPLILISSPYARRGELWEIYRRHHGPDGDPRVIVAQGTSRDFNPTLPQAVVDRALERDPAAASAEYMAQFRTDIEGFVTREAVGACVSLDVRERAPISNVRYYGFVDPSGGSADAMSLCVGHREGNVVVIDALRERRPPFSPEDVVSEFVTLLKSYRVSKVVGDRYAGEWPREQFRKLGVTYEPSEKPKNDLYRDMLPLINSRKIDLLDHARLLTQLVGLERRTARGGRDSIDHAPGAHDDLCNAVAGLATVAKRGSYPSLLDWVSGPDPDDAAQFQQHRFKTHVLQHSGFYRQWR